MSHTLSVVIAIVASLNVLGCAWLIWWTSRSRPDEVSKGEVIDHVWDGDLQERNNPMPRWWLILFFLSIIFCFVYFLLYPALGTFGNVLGWSKASQYDQEMVAAKKQYAPMYAAFAGRDIEDLAKDPKALVLGRSLFANNCIACHGSDARGAPGFPNLTDNDWLHGGAPAQIVETITHGREGVMPALGPALGDQGVDEVADYVLSLSGRNEPPQLVAAGKNRFLLCAACHGADGKGNQAIGAPNLTDDIWLYGGTDAAVRKSIKDGRHGQMPSHAWLGEDKIKLLAAYVYSLSHAP
ncbi:MAG TPA: cytochrome-c oxidase, cbb3-type subunit III [Steroidobacteraceae bacterium]|jgi:cytochrome c oxidase cbb3-type subunit 3